MVQWLTYFILQDIPSFSDLCMIIQNKVSSPQLVVIWKLNPNFTQLHSDGLSSVASIDPKIIYPKLSNSDFELQ